MVIKEAPNRRPEPPKPQNFASSQFRRIQFALWQRLIACDAACPKRIKPSERHLFNEAVPSLFNQGQRFLVCFKWPAQPSRSASVLARYIVTLHLQSSSSTLNPASVGRSLQTASPSFRTKLTSSMSGRMLRPVTR